MSKAHDPHWRYIAVRFKGTKATRKAMANAILGKARKAGWEDDDAPRLLRYEWPHAFVRVPHYRLSEGRELLGRITWTIEAATKQPLEVTTLSSSGTVKTLVDRHKILIEPRKPSKRLATGAARRGTGKGPGGPQVSNRRPGSAAPGSRSERRGDRTSRPVSGTPGQ